MKSYHVALEAFGLSEKEAAVYAAALELGPATADQLSKQATIKRSTTYVQIESLQKVGLMSSYEEGKKTFFAPESPQNLERLLERQQKELELKQSDLKKSLPDLTHLFEGAGERPVVRFYQGKEGIITVREEMLLVKDKQTYVIFAADEMDMLFSETEKDAYTERRIEKEVKTKILYSRLAGPFTGDPSANSERKYLGDMVNDFKSDIVIYDNKAAFFSMSGQVFAVVIESKKIARSLKLVFETLWKKI